MSSDDIIRAWKDPAFRKKLSDEQRAHLPDNPAGIVDLSDDDLKFISGAGGMDTITDDCCTYGSCTIATCPTINCTCPTIQCTCTDCTGNPCCMK